MAAEGAAVAIPTLWTPEQALAVFELLDDLRHKIWTRYGGQIQAFLGDEQRHADAGAHHLVRRRFLVLSCDHAALASRTIKSLAVAVAAVGMWTTQRVVQAQRHIHSPGSSRR